jgi:hypothetical protein
MELGPLDRKVVGIIAESVEEQETKAVPLAASRHDWPLPAHRRTPKNDPSPAGLRLFLKKMTDR